MKSNKKVRDGFSVSRRTSGVLLFLLIFLVGAFQLTADDVSGEIVYLDGGVDVYRDGEMLDYYDVDIGLRLEQYDMVETDDIGYAEIDVVTPSGRGTVVRVFEDTAFYFDYDDSSGSQQTKFEMLTGALALKVQKLSGNGDVIVQTESAVMGVRGTEFTVSAAPEGSILVTCEEGKVSCQSEGREVQAVPGRAVEKPRDGGLRELAVEVGDLGDFRQQWFDSKLENFIPNSGVILKTVAQRYEDFTGKFETSYAELMSYKNIYKRWERSLRDGGSMGAAMKDKITVSPAIIRMRTNLFMFERLFFRIKALAQVYEEYDLPRNRLWAGYSSDDLFRDFARQEKEIQFKLAQTRYIMKLFSEISSSVTPGGNMDMDMDMDMDSFGSNPFGDSSPF